MPIVSFIRLAIRVGIVAIERGVLANILPEVIEEMPTDKHALRDMRTDLERTKHFTRQVIESHIDFGLWPNTGPVEEHKDE